MYEQKKRNVRSEGFTRIRIRRSLFIIGTMTLGYFIFDKVQAGQYYYPSSIGLIFTVIGVPITLAVKWFCDHVIEDVQY